jgi:hypothetical protein
MDINGGSCFPSHEYISDQTELSEKSISRHLKRAAELGWITIKNRSKSEIEASRYKSKYRYQAILPDTESGKYQTESPVADDLPDTESGKYQTESPVADDLPDTESGKYQTESPVIFTEIFPLKAAAAFVEKITIEEIQQLYRETFSVDSVPSSHNEEFEQWILDYPEQYIRDVFKRVADINGRSINVIRKIMKDGIIEIFEGASGYKTSAPQPVKKRIDLNAVRDMARKSAEK